jgi:Putative MetA-pathway of phenol degradation
MEKIFLISCLLLGLMASAQERIDTDRPDQTESAVLVPKKYFQGEFGFGKENSTGGAYTIAHPAFLLKYGLSKRFELRLEGTFFSEHVQQNGDTKTNTDLAPVEIGTKVALFEEKGFLPKTSLIAHVGSSFRGSGPEAWPYYSSFRVTCQHTINESFGLGYNVGAAKEEEGSVLLYTFSPNFNFAERWYSYIEAFGFKPIGSSPEQKWQHALDAGLAYYISNDTKLDVSAGVGLADNPMKNYFAVGFSFRLPLNEKYRLSNK